MRIAYFDCFSGASGDMILGSLLDAGADIEQLRAELNGLKVDGFRAEAEKVRKQGFAATQFRVAMDDAVHQPHRHLQHIQAIIQNGTLPSVAKERALAIFTRLAKAEAAVHGTTIEKVHFHEVGAIDAIVDIVGACLAMERLGIERVYCSAIPTGHGSIRCDHGLMPIPAPATAELLKSVPLTEADELGELTTPTGAAILTTLSAGFGPMPAMRLQKVGVGAGQREGKNRANILRVLIGEAELLTASEPGDEIVVLQTQLDDVSGEVIGHVQQLLMAAGALDVFTTAIQMKKNRPGVLLTVLAAPEQAEKLEEILFVETGTLGIRFQRMARHKLSRSVEQVDTPMGRIAVKVGRRGERIVQAAPEYEDCRRMAEQTNLPLKQIMETVMRYWRQVDR